VLDQQCQSIEGVLLHKNFETRMALLRVQTSAKVTDLP